MMVLPAVVLGLGLLALTANQTARASSSIAHPKRGIASAKYLSADPAKLEKARPAFVCRRIESAMRLTDEALLPRLGQGYAGVRALALAAVHQITQPRVIRNGFSVNDSQRA